MSLTQYLEVNLYYMFSWWPVYGRWVDIVKRPFERVHRPATRRAGLGYLIAYLNKPIVDPS